MSRSIRTAVASAAAAAVIGIVPASAAATAFTSTDHLDFGSAEVGTTTASQPVTLTAPCTTIIVICITAVIDGYTPAPSAGSSDYSVSSTDCPTGLLSLIPAVDGTADSCTINVKFKPTATGTRNGTLSTGTDFLSNAGPTVALTGVGTAPPPPPGGNPNPSPNSGSSGPGVKRRKCKKKSRSGAQIAKKRCKKH